MTNIDTATQNTFKDLIQNAQHIVVLQADNPDGDSLGSALALESILEELGKHVTLYCGVDMPHHLTYLPGWDRVVSELPNSYDLGIIVDTSASSLFEQSTITGAWHTISNRPTIVLDHHTGVQNSLDFAKLYINQPVVATAELIYELARALSWKIPAEAMDAIAVSILSDSLGLTTEATSARSIAVISELVAAGVSIPKLDNARRELGKRSVRLTTYKAKLMERIEYHNDDTVATVTIPWDEIETYSPEYNPSVLVMDEMRMTTPVQVAIAFKVYDDGKITGKIRCNYGYPVAARIAEHFGGGGHVYASGFKVKNKQIADVIAESVSVAQNALKEL